MTDKKEFLDTDFAAIERRILMNDEHQLKLLADLLNIPVATIKAADGDIHEATAMHMFATAKPTEEQRRVAKNRNFTRIYIEAPQLMLRGTITGRITTGKPNVVQRITFSSLIQEDGRKSTAGYKIVDLVTLHEAKDTTVAVIRKLVNDFEERGEATSSGRLFWVFLTYCEANKIPYTVKAMPGTMYFISKGAA